jgi:hypothetical protein
VNVIVVYLISITLGIAGMYDKAGTAEEAEAEEVHRHSH